MSQHAAQHDRQAAFDHESASSITGIREWERKPRTWADTDFTFAETHIDTASRLPR
jgi:hypothetical protein